LTKVRSVIRTVHCCDVMVESSFFNLLITLIAGWPC
jgi:hypothetical protein